MIMALQLLKDYFRRWRRARVFFGLMALLYAGADAEFGLIIGILLMWLAGVFLLQVDFGSSVSRQYRNLPIPPNIVASTFWLTNVIVTPATYWALAIIARLIAASVFSIRPFALEKALLGMTVSMGLIGLYLHIFAFLLVNLNVGQRVRLFTISILVCAPFVVAVESLFLFYFLDPSHTPFTLGPPVFTAMAGLIAASSWFAAKRIVSPPRKKLSGIRFQRIAKTPQAIAFPEARSHGLYFPWALKTLACFFIAFLSLVPLLGFLVYCPELIQEHKELAFMPVFGMASFMIFTASRRWYSATRSLRALPISRLRLTLYFLSFPGIGALCATILTMLYIWMSPILQSIAWPLLAFNAFALGLAAVAACFDLHSGAATYYAPALALVMFLWLSMRNGLINIQDAATPVYAILLALGLGCAGLWGVYNLLGKSSACYRFQGEMARFYAERIKP